HLTAEGREVQRVRVLAEPPSDYQRWEMWGARWNISAGERVGYLTRQRARDLGLPDADWWLLDDERVITMGFDDDGRITGKMLVIDPAVITRYRAWRDLAVRNATPAEVTAAACPRGPRCDRLENGSTSPAALRSASCASARPPGLP